MAAAVVVTGVSELEEMEEMYKSGPWPSGNRVRSGIVMEAVVDSGGWSVLDSSFGKPIALLVVCEE